MVNTLIHVCGCLCMCVWVYALRMVSLDKILHNINDDGNCFYTALFSTLRQTLCAHIRFYMSEYLFIAHF